MAKLPAFQFYPGDWMKDPNLRRCTHTAKGVWIDMLCLMFEADERGVLATAGQAWSDEEIARAVGGDLTTTISAIQELTLKGVVKRRSNGALYSKRMVTDENKRKACSEAGKRGGNPLLRQTLKGTLKPPPKGRSKGELTPSSSSSVSSSSSYTNTAVGENEFPPNGEGAGEDSLPPPPPKPKVSEQTDEQWLDGLKAVPAYTGIDVDREFSKCVQWCKTNRKQPSRRRFINWLNRCEKPMVGPGSKQSEFKGAW